MNSEKNLDDFRLLQNPFADQLVRKELTVGPYRIRPIATTLFGLDGGAMFGTVPKVLWEKSNPADSRNRIAMQARALLLDGGTDGKNSQRILIDCGIGGDFIAKYGEKLGSKFADMYAVMEGAQGENALESALASVGLKTSDISHVFLTHLHFDHCGGATKARDGKIVPTFENAQYFVQKSNYETALEPNLREKASYFAANFVPLKDAGVLTLLNGDVADVLPGISVHVNNGHTTGQQVVKISDANKQTVLYCADLIPTSSHVRLPWIMGYDLDPLLIMKEKKELLIRAAREGWHLFFEHDPYMDAAVIEESKGDFLVKERIALV
jgi:glyoxylase-like metal-dependent hydrolase (beta-lactamase superfamily II)